MNRFSRPGLELKKGLVGFLKRIQNEMVDPLDVYFSYRLLLERNPESKGWLNWCQRIQGGMSRETLRLAFLTSAEYRARHDPASRFALVETDYFKIYADLEDLSVGHAISEAKQYEPHLTTFLRRELRPHMHFLDIGANIGWFTLLAATILTEGRVIAVEPNIYNVQLLNRSLLENGFQQVTVYPFAAAAAPATLALSFIGSNGRIQNEGITPAMQFVQGLPLDQLLPPTTRVDVIKIDIEGYEWLAFQGMTHLLQRNRPLIVTEFHPQAIRDYTGYVPENYLQTFLEMDYNLGVLLPDGQVQPMPNKEAIMAHWRQVNKQTGSNGGLHLDLVARPH